jgi:DnaK suppressor protein
VVRKNQGLVDSLARKADQLERARENIEAQSYGGDERESTGELAIVDQHPADTADFAVQRDLSDTQQRILQQEEDQVRAAIERAKAGQYGICADCGEAIPSDRLKARPEATLCIACQARREGARR